MAVQIANSSSNVINFKAIEIKPEDELNLMELKDVCKHYFEGIKEESTYDSATPERLGRIASFALESIDHFEKYGK